MSHVIDRKIASLADSLLWRRWPLNNHLQPENELSNRAWDTHRKPTYSFIKNSDKIGLWMYKKAHMRRHWSQFPVVFSRTPAEAARPRTGASVSRGMPVYSQLSLALINRPRRDGTPSWRWQL